MRQHPPKPKKTFLVPVYGGRLYLYVDDKLARKALEALFIEPHLDDDDAIGWCLPGLQPTGGAIYVVAWLDGLTSTLVHELGHAAFYILGRAGIDARDSSGEAFCYLQAELLNRCGVR